MTKEGARSGVTIVLANQDGLVVFTSLNNQDPAWYGRRLAVGTYRAACHIPSDFLNAGHYRVSVQLWRTNYQIVARESDVLGFDVHDGPDGRGDYFGIWEGVVRPALHWTTEPVPAEPSYPASPVTVGRE